MSEDLCLWRLRRFRCTVASHGPYPVLIRELLIF